MTQILPIAAGGALGALLRYWTAGGVQSLLGTGFPYGTLVVNVSGCMAIGLLYALLADRPETLMWRYGLITGLLGAYTTFSAFSIDTLWLIEAGEPMKAALNVALSVALCLAACWAGLALGRML